MRETFRLLASIAFAAGLAWHAPAALAQLAFLTTDASMLYRINLSDPGRFSGAPQSLGGVYSSRLAVRPGTNDLYALGGNNGLVYIGRRFNDNPVVWGVWAQGAYTLSGTQFGFNFHPTEDRIRVVSDAEQNLRLNPVVPMATTDTPLAYAAGDPHAGADPNVVAVAYENIGGPGGAPTMYAIDYGLDILALSAAPNEGVLTTVGALGVSPELVVGFDIRTVGGASTAYAVMRVAGIYGLYTIDLGTGGATLLGNLPPGETFTGFAVAPAQVKPPHDFNGDHRSEMLYRNAATGQVYRMQFHLHTVAGNVVFTEPDLAWKIVADGDFDGGPGAGTTDLLWRNVDTGEVYFMPFGSDAMPSEGGRVIHVEPNPDWHIVQTPDLNGDGKADIVWYNTATGQVYGMLLDGGNIVAEGTIHVEPNLAWSIVATLGASRGGRRNQLVWRNSSTGEVYLMTVDVSGSTFTTSGSVIYTEPDAAWRIVGAPDLDGDGKADLIWRNIATGQVHGMLMNGSQIMAQGPIHTEPDMAWKIVATGDYDEDGTSDLLWRNEATGQLHVMFMKGLALSSQWTFYREGNLAWKLLGPYEYAVQ